ncbi:cytochrome P450 2J5-like isoform X1 [Pituophis catenifer annectens]|uniref:cytochrome P450 2J5-like isoform X1 n=1 Tax=Pituophis catenifer annectens TaxID=94852 RepID=UPI00399591A3
MMVMGIFLFVLLLALLILLFFKQLWSRRHLPPSSLALPLIGTLWADGFSLHKDYFQKHVKRYGNIYTMWAGSHLVVVLSGFKAVKEGMTGFSDAFSDRPDDPFLSPSGKGIILSNGLTWKQQRHFGITSLRKMGLGKKNFDHRIEDAAQTLVEIFRQTKGQPFDPSNSVLNVVSNIICHLSFGRQFDAEDDNFQKFIQSLEIVLHFSGNVFHVSRNDPNSTYNEENLAQYIFDIFFAGTETTLAILMWALLLLTNHPTIQEKVKKEIEDVFGFSGSISYQDQKKLPYTNAVIHEMQRLKYALLVGVPRQSTRDVKMRGYHIPKGSIVIADLRSVLLDPEQWETPEEFNPNHFLDKDGKFLDREEFLPFGIGQRSCVGEQLGRIEIFVFLTSLLRAFSFRLPEGVKELNEEPIARMSMHPHPYKLCAIPTQV